MGWREEYEERQKKLKVEVEELVLKFPIEELEKRFFKSLDLLESSTMCIKRCIQKCMKSLSLSRIVAIT